MSSVKNLTEAFIQRFAWLN